MRADLTPCGPGLNTGKELLMSYRFTNSNSEGAIPQNLEISLIASRSVMDVIEVDEINVFPCGAY
jgi:hypothetical protein